MVRKNKSIILGEQYMQQNTWPNCSAKLVSGSYIKKFYFCQQLQQQQKNHGRLPLRFRQSVLFCSTLSSLWLSWHHMKNLLFIDQLFSCHYSDLSILMFELFDSCLLLNLILHLVLCFDFYNSLYMFPKAFNAAQKMLKKTKLLHDL